jgi:MFS-type transporter involved in bile tolerance (Atg22 family)
LAVSLAGYTLAGALWGILLPRLRPAFGVAVAVQRHLFLGQGARMPDTLQLAHTGAREAECNGMVATVESLLIALLAPLLGWLIDLHRSVDTVLVLVGLIGILTMAGSLLLLLTRGRQPARTRTAARLAVALELQRV